ncbi:MAG TPA: VOC family protein [Planctomycetota bacterium]|nr:VOC family protein [Planctomycetota bacterium]
MNRLAARYVVLVFLAALAGGVRAEEKKTETSSPKQKITTFLMFEGKAEEAMKFYMSLFKDSKIVSMSKYGKEGPGPEGTVMHAIFTLDGQEFMAIDSPAKHGFTFTASMSLYVNCATKDEIDTLYKKLSEGGKVFMELGKYPFSERFGWVSDKFGVAWQLTLAK